MHTRLSRAEVPIDETWNLDALFVSDADWETELAAVDAARVSVCPYQGRLLQGAAASGFYDSVLQSVVLGSSPSATAASMNSAL